ncbi:MAG: hypothetical protein A2286_01910 [Gammaproteobacteria bacterium RIFOXYA12_FULL_61_12]|nr:MAG: hypothetical protein A2514_06590 [Gammaproteobacteria bacterium RIFOXYD12_FULL_61_37]OGT94493.1 MAG: hypothetical protein A2286_01910 [Gammaproteobacteria bacterium RIFOXYA12_FULL_61_12]
MKLPKDLQAKCILRLKQGMEQMGQAMTESEQDRLASYLRLLLKWNSAYNLTAVRDPQEMVVRHLLDSLSILPYISGQALLDAGTGPGLPGIPLAIMQPGRRFTLLDSNGKKIRFVRQAALELELENVIAVQQRIEDQNPTATLDLVMARAFTALPQLYCMCNPLLRPGGRLLAMKGTARSIADEMSDLEGVTTEVHRLNVPFLEEERHLVIIQEAGISR